MHPKIDYPGELGPIVADLAAPLHGPCRRDLARSAQAGTEVSLAGGYALEAGAFARERYADVVLGDWRKFMSAAMEVEEKAGGFAIRLVKEPVTGAAAGGSEAYRVRVTAEGCEIAAGDVEGLRRGVFWLEDEMLRRRGPVLGVGEVVRWAAVKRRISRSPIAPYRWLSGWELEDENDYYPEEYLNKLAHCGVNGIWVAGLLRNLVASKAIPELGPSEHRLGKLRLLIEKAARHGIKVYFFCIEPRALPVGHVAGKARPEIAGVHTDIYSTLCPSTPVVREYIRESMRELFREAPGLGGVINIFSGERPTNCGWDEAVMQRCPRCAGRPRAQVLGQMLDAFMQGIREGSETGELLAWLYLIDRNRETGSMSPMMEVIGQSRQDIVWMGNFEHGGVKEMGGKSVGIHEYSLSYVGPSEPFRVLAQRTQETGRKAYAKLQVGVTYEMSSLPYVPAPGIAYEKVAAMSELGIEGAMLNWIPGGFAGPILKAAGEAAFEPRLARGEFLRRLAGIYWGQAQAERVAGTWERMGQAWQGYPFDLAVLYWGPVTRAPAYQLHLEREARTTKLYNFGLERNRDPQYFDDRVERWQGAFSAVEIEGMFRKMAERWRPAAEELAEMTEECGLGDELRKQAAVAAAAGLQCVMTANVYEFYRLRDSLAGAGAEERKRAVKRMREIAQEEIGLAEEMKRWMAVEPSIGYEPELYAYSYSAGMVEEKVRQLRDLLGTLERWERSGVEEAVLKRTVEEAERMRPDRWGD